MASTLSTKLKGEGHGGPSSAAMPSSQGRILPGGVDKAKQARDSLRELVEAGGDAAIACRSPSVVDASGQATLRTRQAKGRHAVPTGLQGQTAPSTPSMQASSLVRASIELRGQQQQQQQQQPTSSLCEVSVLPGGALPVTVRGENWLSSMNRRGSGELTRVTLIDHLVR
ncbi:hypothetical protein MKX07_007234 [Trichoderma sp. CBMAI-0711]|uniref:Uncharacterized protein n=1 Tax=Trichoderma parareesei TaxID=858221 RepID=A0A2H2Z7H2_TRIPA|nr:hypothetical protein MKX07_007234 [Trichoderma sp. CBMAI-0711]OTA03473.1 hypothetical protein A9Z42_0039500 [Trichoderma parareesei]